MANIREISEGRSNVFRVDPSKLTIIGLDTPHKVGEHPLYDERINNPLREEDVLNVMSEGVLVPAQIVNNGDRFEVVAGRQRVRWGREANKRLLAKGSKPILVPVVLCNHLDEKKQMGVMISENEIRSEDAQYIKVEKAMRLLAYNYTEEDVAISFGVSGATVKRWIAFNSLSADVKQAVKEGKLAMSAAVAFAAVPREEQSATLEDVLTDPENDGELTARNAEERVREARPKKEGEPPSPREVKALLKADAKGGYKGEGIYLSEPSLKLIRLMAGADPMPQDILDALKVLRKGGEK